MKGKEKRSWAIKGSLIYFNEAPPSIPEGLEKERGLPEIKTPHEELRGARRGRGRRGGREGWLGI